MTRAGRGADRGSASVLVALAALLTFAVGVGATLFAAALRAGSRARTAADLSALAGAEALATGGDPCAAAGTVARANAARVVACAADSTGMPGAVTVLVEVRPPGVFGRAVLARARAEPGPFGGTQHRASAQLRAPPARDNRRGSPVRAGLRGWTVSSGTSWPLTRWAT